MKENRNHRWSLILFIVVVCFARNVNSGELPFDAIYCFGFSWTDTQGLTMDGTPNGINGNPEYWRNRASNGPRWPELLSPTLGLAYAASNNYARGGSTVADTVTQVRRLKVPPRPERGLYCFMLGNTI